MSLIIYLCSFCFILFIVYSNLLIQRPPLEASEYLPELPPIIEPSPKKISSTPPRKLPPHESALRGLVAFLSPDSDSVQYVLYYYLFISLCYFILFSVILYLFLFLCFLYIFYYLLCRSGSQKNEDDDSSDIDLSFDELNFSSISVLLQPVNNYLQAGI